MTEVYERYEHAGVVVEIVQDDDPIGDPQDNDNAGTLYSWTSSFNGDERIGEPDLLLDESENWDEDPRYRAIDLSEWFKLNYDAALTIPLFFADYGSSGARIYESDNDPNCALVFTQKEIDEEWRGHLDPYPVEMKDADGEPTGEVREYGGARKYAAARINELDEWLQGYVFGVVIRELNGEPTEDLEHVAGEVLESVWGFIGDPAGESGKYIRDEANSMAEGCAEQIAEERAKRFEWACRDVVTV